MRIIVVSVSESKHESNRYITECTLLSPSVSGEGDDAMGTSLTWGSGIAIGVGLSAKNRDACLPNAGLALC